MDAVFKALADPTRRDLLDELFREDGQTLHARPLHQDSLMARPLGAKPQSRRTWLLPTTAGTFTVPFG